MFYSFISFNYFCSYFGSAEGVKPSTPSALPTEETTLAPGNVEGNDVLTEASPTMPTVTPVSQSEEQQVSNGLPRFSIHLFLFEF